jgi:hypothetical protein
MPLKATTIRWDETTYEWLREEARAANITVAQFVREAAIMRAMLRATAREAPGLPLDLKRLAEEVERRARVRRT